jgi:predicted DsbA family dithiol-disulfide isomerase
MKTAQKLQIDVYSDIICPWCWLGKRRLEKALESLPEIQAAIRYLPYELNPATPEEGLNRVKYLNEKYGGGISAVDDRIASYGRDLGMEYHFDRIERIPNTLQAHRVVWLAGEKSAELQAAVTESLHKAYFSEGKDIGDPGLLAETASKAGLDRSAVEQMLAGDRGVREVRGLEEKAYHLGVTGVPFFVFNGKTALSGAHPVEAFHSVLRQCAQA